MITAEEYKLKLDRGETDHLHVYSSDGDAPVVRVQVSKVEKMTPDVTKYEFQTLDGSPLPEWSAGAHLDIVVAPEFLRQYSMSGDPADRSKYQIGVLREDAGRWIKNDASYFCRRTQVFISKPINHLIWLRMRPKLSDGWGDWHYADDCLCPSFARLGA